MNWQSWRSQAKSGRIGPGDISGTVAFQKELEMVELTNALTGGNASEAIRAGDSSSRSIRQ